jgi:hypothetical protein
MTGGDGILLYEDRDVVLTEVEDAPQVGIISLEREIESSGRSRGVCDNKLSSKLLNDDVNDVLRSVFVDGSYVLSSSFELGILVDTERVKEGVVRSSREADPGCLIGGVDSGRLNGTALGDDMNLEPGAGAWDLLASCSTSCRIFFIATRSKPACVGRSEEGGLSLGDVDGLDKAEASPPECVVDCKFGAGEDVCILGGRSSLSTTSPALLGGSLMFVLRFPKVAVEGGRETYFCGVVLVFFLENHPDFFWLSSSRTTIRSSANSGSYEVDKHAE